MTKTKFKVGDSVECINNEKGHTCFKIGQIGKVCQGNNGLYVLNNSKSCDNFNCFKLSDKIPISQIRKEYPVFSGVLKYFPLAIMEVAKISKMGNDKHNPGEPLHWDRSKSTDELDALSRHLIDVAMGENNPEQKFDTDGALHSARVAWRALANLQKELENDRKEI